MISTKLSRRKFFGLAAASAIVAVPAAAKALAPQPVVTMTPCGVLMPYAGKEIPAGFMWCDGAELEAVRYQTLFGIVGRMYGGDEKRGTFRLPDFRTKVGMQPQHHHGYVSHELTFEAPSHSHVHWEAVRVPGVENGCIAQPVFVINYIMAVDDVRIEWQP